MFGKKKPLDPSLDWTKTGSFVHKPSRGWLHSDDSLITGGVSYAVRYVGCLQVLKSMRTLQYDLRQQVTREAILLCSVAAGYYPGKKKKIGKNSQKLLGETPQSENAGCRMNMTISSGGIKLVGVESGRIVANHEMHGISFASGGEKDCIDMVGYVAKDHLNGRACHVLDCGGGLAYDVINTIGQAFEICFKLFLQNPPLATTVPERFSETIFDDTGGDHSSEQEYDEPRNDGFHGIPKSPGAGYETPTNFPSVGYMALKTSTEHNIGYYESPTNVTTAHGYDVPRTSLSRYDVPKMQPLRTVLDDYDNPMGLQPDPFANSNGVNQTNSLAFAAGGLYDNPLSGDGNIAFYENPLAVPKGSTQDDSLERNEIDLADLSFYDTPEPVASLTPVQTTWTTFDDEPPPPPPMTTNPDHQQYNSSQETQRKPPPKPKPYAESKSEKQSIPALEGNSSDHPIGAELWFHGPMSRAEAELLLEDEGDFLVRESTSKAGQYVLSGVRNGHPRHLLLVDPEGKIRTKDREFSTVKELLDYHMENKLPIISSGSEVTISHPVLRQ